MQRVIFSAAIVLATLASAAPPELSLTLPQATEMALKNNLRMVLGRERVVEAAGRRGIGLSFLLPHLAGSAHSVNQTSNLAALGLTPGAIPGFPTFIGPYSVFDARIRLTQSVFNLAAIRNYQASKYGVALAREEESLAAQQVRTAAALAYLAVLETEQAVASAQANVQLGESLLKLATGQRNSGIATGLDVARAETRLANQRVQLAQANTALDSARLELLRLIGAPLTASLKLSDSMNFIPEDHRDAAASVQSAIAARVELRVAGLHAEIAKAQRKAAIAGWAPSVGIVGDYGSSGIQPNQTNLPTRSIGIGVDIPLFDGGRTRSDAAVAASLERQAQARLDDLKLAVEKDVRLALDNLVTREAQVEAARRVLSLATRELDLSQDRFRNGVADNIEVVTAQTALENARQTVVSSLAQYNVARLNLAAATGRVEDFRL